MTIDMPNFTEPALCAEIGGDLWFPVDTDGYNEARRICRRCPAMNECLEYALRHAVTGIWGGASERQRNKMRAARHIKPLPVLAPYVPPCGTAAGARSHYRRNEPACRPCADAARAAKHKRESAA